MSQFLNEDFLLQSEPARQLYHNYASKMAIIDYHCHLSPQIIADDAPFKNLTDIWLRGDHYKWRAMRAFGIPEQFITGSAPDDQKFLKWAELAPYTIRNPLYHWTQMELKNPFGVTDLLNKDTAEPIYRTCSDLLQQPAFSPRALLKHFQVEVVVSTDDPCDDLAFHQQLAGEDFGVKVLPCFRPDKIFQLTSGDAFREYVSRLGTITAIEIDSIDRLLEALSKRVDYFHAAGCRFSDHGFDKLPLIATHAGELDQVFKNIIGGDDSAAYENLEAYSGLLLFELCRMYHGKGWTQQFHLGAIRNNNTRMLKTLGPDTGFDSIGDEPQAFRLSRFFDALDQTDQLAQTIIYNNNPADNEVYATMAGNYNDGSRRGKMQFGSAWWHLDQKDGIEKQLNALSNMGMLSCFVGMVTDSRSFLSYSRHEYFRRVLCNLIGDDISKGLLPNDIGWMGKIVQDISYHNARNYFSFTL